MLKGAIQTSMNLVKEQSNQLIKDFIKKITDLQDLYTNDATGYGLIYDNIKNDINKLKEEENSLKHNVQICEYRVNRCENDIGYHLLGNKSNSNLLEGKKEETK